MQAQCARSGDNSPGGNAAAVGQLLLVGSEDLFRNEISGRVFSGHKFQVAGRSTSLLDGLARLETASIDLVLLSPEFSDAERSLFTLDAERRGFDGLILRVAAATNGTVAGPRSRGPLPLQARLPMASTPIALEFSGQKPVSFTPKEQAVLARVSEGWTNQQIASDLKCSEGSVKAVLQQLFDKLGVRKRARIVRLALETRLQQPDTRLASEEEPERRTRGKPDLPERDTVHIGDLDIDVSAHRAWVRGVEFQFAPREFKLLKFFSEHPGELLPHNDLLTLLWGSPAASRDSLRVLIQALRSKIETTGRPRYIVTQHHVGYRFNPAPL